MALNGMIYTSSANGRFSPCARARGASPGAATVWNGGFGTPAVTSTGVYASYPCSTYDFQPLTGTQLFFTNTGCEGGGGIHAGRGQRSSLFAVGEFEWWRSSRRRLDRRQSCALIPPTADPAFSAAAGYFLQSGTLNALTSSNNTVLWSFTGDGSLSTSPIVVNQTVIIGSSSGNVYALNAATGQQLWTVNAGGALQPGNGSSGLAAGDGLLNHAGRKSSRGVHPVHQPLARTDQFVSWIGGAYKTTIARSNRGR